MLAALAKHSRWPPSDGGRGRVDGYQSNSALEPGVQPACLHRTAWDFSLASPSVPPGLKEEETQMRSELVWSQLWVSVAGGQGLGARVCELRRADVPHHSRGRG